MTTLSDLDRLHAEATPGPWEWAAFGDVQLHGNVEAPDMNPILVARGCGNTKATELGVTGCMPEKLGDPLRACPLHPSKSDRDLIVALRNAYPALRAYVAALEAERDASRVVARSISLDGTSVKVGVSCVMNKDTIALRQARLATDAARAQMEKQDG